MSMFNLRANHLQSSLHGSLQKYLVICLFLFLLTFSLSYAKSFSIQNADVEYIVNSNGTVSVHEEIFYNLHCEPGETFKELYRTYPEGLSVARVSGYCKNQNCNFIHDLHGVSGKPELILELSDGCGPVTAMFEYELYTLIKHNDTVQFYYKLWGDESPKVTNMNIDVVAPGPVSQTTYFIHPWGQEFNVQETSNSIFISKQSYPSGTYVEINLLMPTQWFTGPSSYFVKGTSSKQEIIEIEENERDYGQLIGTVLLVVGVVLLICLPLLPWGIAIIVYYVHGREFTPLQINYNGLYEREPVQGFVPAQAEFFIDGQKEFTNSLQATIVSLAAQGFLKIEKQNKDYHLIFTDKKGKLNSLEKQVYDKLKGYVRVLAGKTVLSVNQFKNKHSQEREFYNWHNLWVKNVEKSLNTSQYIDSHGFNLFSTLVGVILILQFIFFIVFVLILEYFSVISLAIVLGGASSFVCFILFNKKKIWLSRWTKEGRVLNLKFTNFKKYLSDYSLMKEHPPESVVLWEQYLAYATAFGVAKKTVKAMEKVNPQFVEQTRNFNMFTYLYVASFMPRYTPQGSSSYGGGWSGGFGGAGGGFGGGGFGAR